MEQKRGGENGRRQQTCAHKGARKLRQRTRIDVDVEAEDKGRGTWKIWEGNDGCSRQWRKQKYGGTRHGSTKVEDKGNDRGREKGADDTWQESRLGVGHDELPAQGEGQAARVR